MTDKTCLETKLIETLALQSIEESKHDNLKVNERDLESQCSKHCIQNASVSSMKLELQSIMSEMRLLQQNMNLSKSLAPGAFGSGDFGINL
jgi:hypothetical protein